MVHGVIIQPGRNGVCPFCPGTDKTFHLKKDDTLGKCFHLSCGKFITLGSLAADFRGSLFEVLATIAEDCHAHLMLQAKEKQGFAYQFLTKERKVHDKVIEDLSTLGAVPPNYDVEAAFKPAIDDLAARSRELAAKIEESLKRRLEAKEGRAEDHKQGKQQGRPTAKSKTNHEKAWENELVRLRESQQSLHEQCDTLKEVMAKATHWIAFFHTDALHRVRSIRFRKAYEKHFMSFVPFGDVTGLFGHSLFNSTALRWVV